MSYIAQDGEWRTKKISIVSAVSSIISQLRAGQDLTHISLPVIFFHPYSLLEVGAYKCLSRVPVLLDAYNHRDPLERMLSVVRWYLIILGQERFEKKPYNPILGECHSCWVEDPNHGTTAFVAEQVSHHPPISLFAMMNLGKQLTMEMQLSFSIEFTGNNAEVSTSGRTLIRLKRSLMKNAQTPSASPAVPHTPQAEVPTSNHSSASPQVASDATEYEEYEFSKSYPSMEVTNIIIGLRKELWTNEIIIKCPSTGYKAKLTYGGKQASYFSDCSNTVTGQVFQYNGDEEILLYELFGKCGEEISMKTFKEPGSANNVPNSPLNEKEKEKEKEKKKKKGLWAKVARIGYKEVVRDGILIDGRSVERLKVNYQFSDPLDSINVWKEVNENIVKDDLAAADVAKVKVEEGQRLRRSTQSTAAFAPRYFAFDDEQQIWRLSPKGNEFLKQLAKSNASLSSPSAPTQYSTYSVSSPREDAK